MKLVVGSRGSFKSTKAIIDGTRGRIAEIYISVDNSRWGSGRNYVHEIDFGEVTRQVAYARKFGITISLAFNSVCFGKDKFTKRFLADFRQTVKDSEKEGLTAIILSDPFLMEIVKEEFPGLEVIVSVFAECDSENRLEYYNELGVDRIIIPHELNRNMEKLKKFVKLSSCDLEVITNLGCSHYCARGDAHSMFTGHYTGEKRKKIFGDYYTSFCNRYKLNEPWMALSQDWIRPEDIYRYEQIGIKYFKIAGRATATTRIINTCNAYLARSYEGNLFDLISSYYPFVERMPCEKSPFNIPNKKLDPYMDRLYSCGHKCDTCRLCKEVYEKISEAETVI